MALLSARSLGHRLPWVKLIVEDMRLLQRMVNLGSALPDPEHAAHSNGLVIHQSPPPDVWVPFNTHNVNAQSASADVSASGAQPASAANSDP